MGLKWMNLRGTTHTLALVGALSAQMITGKLVK